MTQAEELHRDFLLAALRAASLRCKTWDADLTTIGVALKGDLIGNDTAVRWIRDAGLLNMVGAIPEEVGRVARQNLPPIKSQTETDDEQGEG
jgi:hypothetical protein